MKILGKNVQSSLDIQYLNKKIKSSMELRFNVVERYKYCGKPSTHEGGLCDNCYRL